MKIISRDELISNSVNFWILKELPNGDNLVAKPLKLEMEKHPEAFLLPEPTFRMTKMEAQQFCQSLVDELTQMGYRANTDKIAGKLDAQTDHLNDMQKIVNQLLRKVCND